jgi:hypothetical protein
MWEGRGQAPGQDSTQSISTQDCRVMNYIVEEESGTYTGSTRRHNGYYAGDFASRPLQPLELGISDLRVTAAA